MGAAAGAVVAGPIGAVAGGVIGYSAGRRIARGLGFRDSQPRRVRHHRAVQR
jgi:outer membrane lipoprotein SlyB